MPAILGRVARHHDLVTLAGPDLVIAAGTAIRLVGLVRLHVPHLDLVVVVGKHQRGNAAHNTSSATMTSAAATSTMSLLRRFC